MNNIFKIFKRDCHLVRSNLIAMVVAFGLVVIPSLYAWFNIAAEWDPYSNTGGIRVAVANDDEGYTSELMPLEVNMGDQVESALRENTQLEWIFTTSDEAVEGVRSGEYYAALVIPDDFTADMLNVLTGDEDHPTITYYSNQKESAIAPKVTDQGADTVRTTVNQVFTETLTDVGASLVEQMGDYLDSDKVESIAGRLTEALTTASTDLRSAAAQVNTFADLMNSTTGLVSSSEALIGSTSSSTDGLKKLVESGKNDVANIASDVDGATDKANAAIDDMKGQLDNIDELVDKAFAAGEDAAPQAAQDMKTQAEVMRQSAQSFTALASDLKAIQSQISSTDPAAAQSIGLLISYAEGTASSLNSLATKLDSAADGLLNYDNTQDKAEIKAQIAAVKDSINAIDSSFEDELKSQANQLVASIDKAQTNGSAITGDLKTTMADLQSVVSSASNGMSVATTSLGEAAATLTSAADDLDEVVTKVNDALNSGDLDTVRTIIANDPTALASSISDPIGLDTRAIWEMENTGSSMAAYFSTLATWVGCVVLGAMLKVQVSQNSQDELKDPKPRHLYFGRFLFFWMLGIFQSTLIALGDIFFLKIQLEHPLLFLATICIASTVFMTIVYALVVSFGDVGKAIGVVFMVLQVAGAGGIFPVEVMPDFFQVAYPFLPFVHAMNMMKYCIAGGLSGEWLSECAMLLAFIVPALLLGLALRKPVIRLNEWLIEQLEETKLM